MRPNALQDSFHTHQREEILQAAKTDGSVVTVKDTVKSFAAITSASDSLGKKGGDLRDRTIQCHRTVYNVFFMNERVRRLIDIMGLCHGKGLSLVGSVYALEAVWQTLIEKNQLHSVMQCLHVLLMRGDLAAQKVSNTGLRGSNQSLGITKMLCCYMLIAESLCDHYDVPLAIRKLITVDGYNSTYPSAKQLQDYEACRIPQTWDPTWQVGVTEEWQKLVVDFLKLLWQGKLDEGIRGAWKKLSQWPGNGMTFIAHDSDLNLRKEKIDEAKQASASGSALKEISLSQKPTGVAGEGGCDDNMIGDGGDKKAADPDHALKTKLHQQQQQLKGERISYMELDFMIQDESKIQEKYETTEASKFVGIWGQKHQGHFWDAAQLLEQCSTPWRKPPLAKAGKGKFYFILSLLKEGVIAFFWDGWSDENREWIEAELAKNSSLYVLRVPCVYDERSGGAMRTSGAFQASNYEVMFVVTKGKTILDVIKKKNKLHYKGTTHSKCYHDLKRWHPKFSPQVSIEDKRKCWQGAPKPLDCSTKKNNTNEKKRETWEGSRTCCQCRGGRGRQSNCTRHVTILALMTTSSGLVIHCQELRCSWASAKRIDA